MLRGVHPGLTRSPLLKSIAAFTHRPLAGELQQASLAEPLQIDREVSELTDGNGAVLVASDAFWLGSALPWQGHGQLYRSSNLMLNSNAGASNVSLMDLTILQHKKLHLSYQ